MQVMCKCMSFIQAVCKINGNHLEMILFTAVTGSMNSCMAKQRIIGGTMYSLRHMQHHQGFSLYVSWIILTCQFPCPIAPHFFPPVSHYCHCLWCVSPCLSPSLGQIFDVFGYSVSLLLFSLRFDICWYFWCLLVFQICYMFLLFLLLL